MHILEYNGKYIKARINTWGDSDHLRYVYL